MRSDLLGLVFLRFLVVLLVGRSGGGEKRHANKRGDSLPRTREHIAPGMLGPAPRTQIQKPMQQGACRQPIQEFPVTARAKSNSNWKLSAGRDTAKSQAQRAGRRRGPGAEKKKDRKAAVDRQADVRKARARCASLLCRTRWGSVVVFLRVCLSLQPGQIVSASQSAGRATVARLGRNPGGKAQTSRRPLREQ